jgi:riboflavin biosynthesis pyrimidine reductase
VEVVVLSALDARDDGTDRGTDRGTGRGIDRDAAVAQLLAALAERGLSRVLVEGGATTVSGFLEAGVLDRLWITTAPVLVGDGVPGLRFTGADLMDDALRPPARRFLLGDDVAVELDLAALRAARAEREAAGERISA